MWGELGVWLIRWFLSSGDGGMYVRMYEEWINDFCND